MPNLTTDAHKCHQVGIHFIEDLEKTILKLYDQYRSSHYLRPGTIVMAQTNRHGSKPAVVISCSRKVIRRRLKCRLWTWVGKNKIPL